MTPDGAVTTLAGSPGTEGSADGLRGEARFHHPEDVAVDSEGNVYVADKDNNAIRKIASDGMVSTLAGSPGRWGGNDGVGMEASFGEPSGIVVDAAGNVYVADEGTATIRMVTSTGVVTTLAGSAGDLGSQDGVGSEARFGALTSLAMDGAGNIYVSDVAYDTVRKITPTGIVSTLAGSPGIEGSRDGVGGEARFNFIQGIAVDDEGIIYVAESLDSTIRKIAPGGVVTTFAGSSNPLW